MPFKAIFIFFNSKSQDYTHKVLNLHLKMTLCLFFLHFTSFVYIRVYKNIDLWSFCNILFVHFF